MRGSSVKVLGFALGSALAVGACSDPAASSTGTAASPQCLGVLHSQIYFEDHNAGALVEVDLSTDEARPAIRADVSEPAVSGSGNFAYTFVDPKRTDTVCIQPTNPR